MIEYAITAFRDISFFLNSPDTVLWPYFIFGAILMGVIGYWIKKMMGAFIALLIVLFAYLHLTGFFDRII
jgi:hypothetical protein